MFCLVRLPKQAEASSRLSCRDVICCFGCLIMWRPFICQGLLGSTLLHTLFTVTFRVPLFLLWFGVVLHLHSNTVCFGALNRSFYLRRMYLFDPSVELCGLECAASRHEGSHVVSLLCAAAKRPLLPLPSSSPTTLHGSSVCKPSAFVAHAKKVSGCL